MIGPEGAGRYAAAWLVDALPRRLRIIEAALALPANSLADPSLIEDHETGPVALEQWPAVYVLPQRASAMRLVDVGPNAAETYRVTYPTRILAWLRADTFSDTDLLRKRYALAIREALIERKQLKAPAAYLAAGYGDDTSVVTVDPASIREDYSGLVDKVNGATIAGVFVDVDLSFTETLEGAAPLGQVSTPVQADTVALPPHPGNN